MRRRTEFVLALLLIGTLVAGFLLYQDRLSTLDIPRREPIIIPNPDLG